MGWMSARIRTGGCQWPGQCHELARERMREKSDGNAFSTESGVQSMVSGQDEGQRSRGEGCEDFLCAFGHLDQCSGLVKIGDAEAHNQIFRTSFDLEEAIQCSCIGQAAQRGLSRGGVDDR